MSTSAYQLRSRAVATTSGLAIVLSLGAAAANAQTAGSDVAGSTAATADNTVSEVVVVGARASQQSAIDRKKRARTATDSIVADDVGSFPDRNLNEAISRVAGTALDRNDFGEGGGVSIRGNGPDFTRVELDGIGVQAGGAGMAAGNDGRGADMRELPADLIKSVDIIKGSTAAMTEGGLGGSVQITTRSGLDFKKPYLSLRLGVGQNDLDEKYTPDINLVASRKFFDGRLGAIASVTKTRVMLSSHQMQTVTSANAGYARNVDFDNSPEKTFTYNPAAVRGDTINTVLANSSFTPLQIVEKSAAAQTKADCLTAFPSITTTSTSGGLPASDSSTLTNQKNQRRDEQQSCLNQWNDYYPSLIRNFTNTNDDDRTAADLRLDFRVSDNLTVYAKYSIANRKVEAETRNRNLGGVSINPTTVPASFVDSINSNPANCSVAFNALAADNGFPARPNPNRCATATDINYRYALPGSGLWTYNADAPTGTISRDIAPGATTVNTTLPLYGQAVNVDPSSIKIDENHHLTQFTFTNGVAGIDQISNTLDNKSSYMQLGGEYDNGPLNLKFVAQRGEGSYSTLDLRTSRSYPYGAVNGPATLTLQPSGLWSYDLPAGYDESNPANFVVVQQRFGARGAVTSNGVTYPQFSALPTYTNPAGIPVYTDAQRARTTDNYQITFSPRMSESTETSAKLDLTYDLRDRSDFFTKFSAGVSYRNSEQYGWQGGGYTVRDALGTYNPLLTPEQNVAAGYQPAITVPGNNIRGNYRACEEQTQVAGYEPCYYGFRLGDTASNGEFTPNRFSFNGQHTFTPAELTALFASTLEDPTATFFDDYPGVSGLSNWQGVDVRAIFAATGAQPYLNLDCMKVCTGSDGQLYQQPKSGSEEPVIAAYAMFDFAHDLPLGTSFDGNIGVRRVQRTQKGNALFTYTSITLNDPSNPAGATTTYSVRQPKVIDSTTIDLLPSLNMNLWMFDDKLVARYYTGKTITPPSISALLPNGTCTYDERRGLVFDDTGTQEDQNCARQGNPALKPYEAVNQNVALEWYPNRDSMFSVAWFEQDVKRGGAIGVTKTNVRFFEGSDDVDARTGRPLSELEFTVPTWENGPGFVRTGIEYSAKTAFTFLPWFLRHTGADFNYSTVTSKGSASFIDPLTAEGQKPQNESDYFQNLSVWYDDGRINARVSYQTRGETFINVSAAGANTVNNIPTGNPGALERTPYNPGEPYFKTENAFLDAKITYKLRPDLEVYLEGRNLRQEANEIVGSQDRGFADGTPNLWNIAYAGRRYMFGLVYRYGAK